ncbi:hypothetical protein OH687_11190 [Burkholderia anthina]|nr:hypothetical protein OH687_11190 [Burkholderia anthina]
MSSGSGGYIVSFLQLAPGENWHRSEARMNSGSSWSWEKL